MKRIAEIHGYQLKLKVLTPTHIGGGEGTSINESQYIYDSRNKRLHILDERRLIKFLSERQLLQEYSRYIESLPPKGDENDINSINSININEWYLGLPNMQGSIGLLESCVKYSLDTTYIAKGKLNDIDCFLKDVAGFPYIPGSSIKGSIVNAILVREILRNKHEYKTVWDEIYKEVLKNDIYRGKIKKFFDFIIKKNISPGKYAAFRGMQGLSISDSTPLSMENIIIHQGIDLLKNYNSYMPLSLFRECLVAPAETMFSLSIDSYKMKSALNIKSIEDIIECLNEQYQLLYGKNGILRVFQDIDDMLPTNDEKGGFIILGGGSGYHSKTILAALAPNQDELLQVSKRLLHKGEEKIINHREDTIISPRTLKVSEYDGKTMVDGICRIEVLQNA